MTGTLRYLLCVSMLALPALAHAQNETTTTSIERVANDDDKESVEFTNPYFAKPTLLMVGDKPMNTAAGQMYPSPAMYDVDGDGQDELVLGDIWGTLDVFENISDSKEGDPVWSKFSPLKNSEGEEIKVSNW